MVKSIPELLTAVEEHRTVFYGKALEFRHSWDAFTPESQQLLRLLRRQISARKSVESSLRTYGSTEKGGPAGGMALNGEIFDGLVSLYETTGWLGGYELKSGMPALTMQVNRRRGGVEVAVSPSLGWTSGLDHEYLYSEDTLWQLDRAGSARLLPALKAPLRKESVFHHKGRHRILQLCAAGAGAPGDH